MTLIELYENEVAYTNYVYDQVGLADEVIKFVEYNANKALMNLGLEPIFPTTANDVNPIIMNGISVSTASFDFFSQVGNGYLMGNAEAMEDEDYTIEYEIESSKKLSRDDIKDIRDELKDNYDIREDISEAREVDVVFTVFVDDIEEDQIDVEMDVLKIEGDWYISFLTTDDLPSL